MKAIISRSYTAAIYFESDKGTWTVLKLQFKPLRRRELQNECVSCTIFMQHMFLVIVFIKMCLTNSRFNGNEAHVSWRSVIIIVVFRVVGVWMP